MGARSPRAKVNDLFSADSLLALGSKRVQEQGGGSFYIPYPEPHASNFGLQQSAEVETYIDARTGALVVLPPGVDMDMVLDED